jgi:ribosome-associated translation inhibitor RaiA
MPSEDRHPDPALTPHRPVRPEPDHWRAVPFPIRVEAAEEIAQEARAHALVALGRAAAEAGRQVRRAHVRLRRVPPGERAFAQAVLDVDGAFVRAQADAASLTEAIDLLARRLRAKLVDLERREPRQEPSAASQP